MVIYIYKHECIHIRVYNTIIVRALPSAHDRIHKTPTRPSQNQPKALLGSSGSDSGALWPLKSISRPLQNHYWAWLESMLVHLCTSRAPQPDYKSTTWLDRGHLGSTGVVSGAFWHSRPPQDHWKTITGLDRSRFWCTFGASRPLHTRTNSHHMDYRNIMRTNSTKTKSFRFDSWPVAMGAV